MKKLIVFVCKGNIHRSALAEQCLKQLLKEKGLNDEFEVMSRGISEPGRKNMTECPRHWKTTGLILKGLGIDIFAFSNREAKVITEEIINRSHVIFAMDKEVLEDHETSLIKRFPKHAEKIKFFTSMIGDQDDVPDCGPYPDDSDLHRLINEKIVNTIMKGEQNGH